MQFKFLKEGEIGLANSDKKGDAFNLTGYLYESDNKKKCNK